jgi:lysophospholipase L1-like esterase
LIVVALGTNNSTIASPHHIFAKYYAALADRLMPHAQKLMFVGLPRIDMEASTNGMTVDGVHLTAAGYKPWGAAILSGVESELGCKTAQN